MVGATIIQIIGIITLSFALLFATKNFLMKFIQSEETYKNVLLFASCIILLITSILFIALGTDLKDVINTLIKERDFLGPASIEKLELNKLRFESAIVIVGIILSISLSSLCILFIAIKKEIKVALNDPSRHWNWNKVK